MHSAGVMFATSVGRMMFVVGSLSSEWCLLTGIASRLCQCYQQRIGNIDNSDNIGNKYIAADPTYI